MVRRAPEGGTADDVPGHTRPVPGRWARPPAAAARSRGVLKRAAFAVATVIALFVLAAGALLLATPSATEATRLAEQQAAQHGYYGLQAASCGYFGRPPSELTVNQGAMLAGVVNAPSIDDPVNDPMNARARLAHVIARMVAVGYLTPAQGTRELTAPLGIVPRDQAGCSM